MTTDNVIPVEFPSSGSRLKGWFFPSVTRPSKASVIFLQGFPGTEGDELICGALAAEGFNVLTFNYRGTFQSEGVFTFQNAVADIGAARDFITRPETIESYGIDPDNILLGGWSFGGAMLPAGAVRFPEFCRLFIITGRNFGAEARKIAGDPDYARIVLSNITPLRVPNGPLNFKDDLLDELAADPDAFEHSLLAPHLVDRDILLIGAWDDEVVPIEDHVFPFYRALKAAGSRTVRIEAVQDGHEFVNSKVKLVEMILDWVG